MRLNVYLGDGLCVGWRAAAVLPLAAGGSVRDTMLRLAASATCAPYAHPDASLHWLGEAVLLCPGEEVPDTHSTPDADGYTHRNNTGEALYWEWSDSANAPASQLAAALEVLSRA